MIAAFQNCSGSFETTDVSSTTGLPDDAAPPADPTPTPVPPTLPPPPPTTTPDNPLFFDNFNYVGNSAMAFLNAGWTGIKTIAYTRPGARGEITTENGILRMQAFGEAQQTDFYLQYGEIPARVTFEMDILIDENSGGVASGFKFIYPAPNGSYPVVVETVRWLFTLSPNNISPPMQQGNGRELFLRLESINYARDTGPGVAPENVWKMGHNVSGAKTITFGVWHRLKIHIDFSGEQGIYEGYIDNIKVAEFRGGVTPNFQWLLPAIARGSHPMFRMPTTISEDLTIFLDNFTIY
jgi:hypothetical protein